MPPKPLSDADLNSLYRYLDAKFEGVDLKIDNIEEKVDAVKSDVVNLKRDLDGFEDSVNGIKIDMAIFKKNPDSKKEEKSEKATWVNPKNVTAIIVAIGAILSVTMMSFQCNSAPVQQKTEAVKQ